MKIGDKVQYPLLTGNIRPTYEIGTVNGIYPDIDMVQIDVGKGFVVHRHIDNVNPVEED
jgi:hypothetical protein